MATLQIQIDDALKKEAEDLFFSLGLDIATAVRIFLNAAVENAGIPFSVQHQAIPISPQKGNYRGCHRQNLNEPYNALEEEVDSMMEEYLTQKQAISESKRSKRVSYKDIT